MWLYVAVNSCRNCSMGKGSHAASPCAAARRCAIPIFCYAAGPLLPAALLQFHLAVVPLNHHAVHLLTCGLPQQGVDVGGVGRTAARAEAGQGPASTASCTAPLLQLMPAPPLAR